jgi:SAM-dependent methyltransferase
LHRRLLDVLADPDTGEPLALSDDRGHDWIEDGELVTSSGRTYPIVRGVPRFVSSEDYSSSFGLQWNRFASVQLDSATGASYSQRRFDEEVGWSADEMDGAWIVDAGCGAGRFADIVAGRGAHVVAVDLSAAVEVVGERARTSPNLHPIQADLRRLPLRPGAVAGLYSIGVLQHTPDPIASARRLVELLPSSGRFALTIYGRKRWTKLYAKYWWRPLTTRMRPERLLAVIEGLMPLLFPLTSVLFSLPVLGRLFQFVIPVANYVDRSDLPRHTRYQEAILDTFDMLAPRYDRPVTADEVEQGLRGLVDALEVRSRVPVVVRGARRA